MNKSDYLRYRKSLKFEHQPKIFWSNLAFDCCFAVLTLGALLNKGPLSLLGALTLPWFMFRQFSIMHEAVHGNLHPNKRINDGIGIIAGTFSLLELYQWRKVHLEHHYWTGNIHKDPTLAIIKKFRYFPEPVKTVLDRSWKMGIPALAFAQHIVFWMNIILRIKNNPADKKSVLILLGSFSLYVSLLIFLPAMGLVSLCIGLGIYLHFVEVINFPHHVGLYLSDESSKLHAWDQDSASRSGLYPRFFSRLFLLNFNYHTEHHLYADLPWYELDRAHKFLFSEEKNKFNKVEHQWTQDKRNLSLQQFLEGSFHEESETVRKAV